MNVKGNSLPYIYLILSCLGIISVLAISIPAIYRHYRNVDVLSNAIKINIMNHDEQLAEFNQQLLESQNSVLKSLILGTIISVAILLRHGFRGIAMITVHQMGTHTSNQSEIVDVE